VQIYDIHFNPPSYSVIDLLLHSFYQLIALRKPPQRDKSKISR